MIEPSTTLAIHPQLRIKGVIEGYPKLPGALVHAGMYGWGSIRFFEATAPT